MNGGIAFTLLIYLFLSVLWTSGGELNEEEVGDNLQQTLEPMDYFDSIEGDETDESVAPPVSRLIPEEGTRMREDAWEEELYPEDFVAVDPGLLSKGPLDKRHFVAEALLPRTGKRVEGTYRFQLYREKRDNWNEHVPKPHEQLDEVLKTDLKNPPSPFKTSTVYIHYAHQLSAAEKAEDSSAKLGSRCMPTTILEPDYCERAAYPNKNKMVCNSVEDPKKGLVAGTCTCKFYRVSEIAKNWKQMHMGKIKLSGTEVEACLVPQNGVCNHRVFTGYKDKRGRPIYEVDVCQGHFQCDNRKFYKYLKSGGNMLEVWKHCTEDEFLAQFKEDKRKDVLLCAKPNPRRFGNYDEFKFYCLPEDKRDPQLKHYKPLDSIDRTHRDVL